MLPAEARIAPSGRVGPYVRMVLTPDLARRILAHNSRVTDPSDTRVAEFARRITAGQWNSDTVGRRPRETITFSQSLVVGNGCHRLQAVDLADRPITVDAGRWAPPLSKNAARRKLTGA
jgi:hypothetical protein